MRKEREFIIIKYLLLVGITFQLTLNNGETNAILVILLGFFIINNQIRVYFLKDKYIPYSIIAEILLSIFVFNFYGGSISIYLLPSIIDSFTMLKEKKVRVFILIQMVICLYLFISNEYIEGINSLVYLLIITLIMSYLKRENKEKKNAQELYDKLRIKEEELKEANKYLENYAASIEELTLLKERNRISRDIHDSVGHALSTTMIQLSAMERISEKEGSSLVDIIKYLREFVMESLNEVRIAVRQLKPNEYESYEGIFRIEDLTKNFSKLTGIKVVLKVSIETWSLSERQATNLYRIIQESLSNALKHGNATLIKINMNFSKEGLVVFIEDNGCGCKNILNTGVGISSIRERVSELRGVVSFNSEEGNGFKTVVKIGKEVKGEF